ADHQIDAGRVLLGRRRNVTRQLHQVFLVLQRQLQIPFYQWVNDKSNQRLPNRFKRERARRTEDHDVIVSDSTKQQVFLLIQHIASYDGGVHWAKRIGNDKHLASSIPRDDRGLLLSLFGLPISDHEGFHVHNCLGRRVKVLEDLVDQLAHRAVVCSGVGVGNPGVLRNELPDTAAHVELSHERNKLGQWLEVFGQRLVRRQIEAEARRRSHEQTQSRVTRCVRRLVNALTSMRLVEVNQFGFYPGIELG